MLGDFFRDMHTIIVELPNGFYSSDCKTLAQWTCTKRQSNDRNHAPIVKLDRRD